MSLLILFSVNLISCDDDDDSSSDSASADDDDDTGDDDAVDDDSLSDDDDSTADDDFIDDDDDDDDTGPTYLMVFGLKDSEYTSFRQTEKGWIEQSMPNPATGWPGPELGPMSFANGEQGHGVWNQFGDMVSAMHVWMDYDPEDGWSLKPLRPQAHMNAAVTNISAYGAGGNFWASSYVWQIFVINNYLYQYTDDAANEQLDGHVGASHNAMYFFDVENGYVSGSSDSGNYLLRLLDNDWQWVGMPPEFGDYQFKVLEMFDMHNGLGIIDANAHTSRLVRMTDDVWTPVTPPQGCVNMPPEGVFGNEDRAVVIRYSQTEERFWDYRDGQWSCRQVDQTDDSVKIIHATVWRNGRVFLAGLKNSAEPVLYEVLADSVVPVDVPHEITTIYGVFALGAQAPHQANWRLIF